MCIHVLTIIAHVWTSCTMYLCLSMISTFFIWSLHRIIAIIIPCIFVLQYERRKIIWMFYETFADEGINAMDNLNIYNAEGYNMLSPGIQPLTTESVLKIRVCTVQLCNCIFYSRKCVAVYKTKQSNFKHVWVVLVQ
jgi:hypothetical protein